MSRYNQGSLMPKLLGNDYWDSFDYPEHLIDQDFGNVVSAFDVFEPMNRQFAHAWDEGNTYRVNAVSRQRVPQYPTNYHLEWPRIPPRQLSEGYQSDIHSSTRPMYSQHVRERPLHSEHQQQYSSQQHRERESYPPSDNLPYLSQYYREHPSYQREQSSYRNRELQQQQQSYPRQQQLSYPRQQPSLPREHLSLYQNQPLDSNLNQSLTAPLQQQGYQGVGLSSVQNTADRFQVSLDCRHFSPDEITVEHGDNNSIVIHGKHEERSDEHGFITREFTRRYVLPRECNVDQINASWQQNGSLQLTCQKSRDAKDVKESSSRRPITVGGGEFWHQNAKSWQTPSLPSRSYGNQFNQSHLNQSYSSNTSGVNQSSLQQSQTSHPSSFSTNTPALDNLSTISNAGSLDSSSNVSTSINSSLSSTVSSSATPISSNLTTSVGTTGIGSATVYTSSSSAVKPITTPSTQASLSAVNQKEAHKQAEYHHAAESNINPVVADIDKDIERKHVSKTTTKQSSIRG